MFKHTLVTKYPAWEKASTDVSITATNTNPWGLFDINDKLADIAKEVEMARTQSLERGGDGDEFKSNWSFERSSAEVEIIKSLGIEVVVEYEWKTDNKITFHTATVSGYKQLKEHYLYANIPTQEYSCTEIDINASIIAEVDKLEKRAQELWAYCDPEPSIERLYNKAMALCNTDDEREYVKSRAWS